MHRHAPKSPHTQHSHTPTRPESSDQLIRRLCDTTPEALAAEAERPALVVIANRLGVTGYGRMNKDELSTAVCDAAKTAQQRKAAAKSTFFSPQVGNAPKGVNSAKRNSEDLLTDPTVTAKQPRFAEVSERGCS